MASLALSRAESDIWILSGWSFRMLFEHLMEQIDERDVDFARIQQAYYLQTLHFDLLEVDQARRIAQKLGNSAAQLRDELLATAPDDVRYSQNLQVAEKLADIEARMHEFAASADDSP